MLLRITCVGLILIICVFQAQSSPVAQNKNAAERQSKAEELLKYMNKTEDPCDDFYNYVCGNYGTYNPATIEQPSTGLLESLQTKLDANIKTILNADAKEDTAIDKKVKRYYRSCLKLSELGDKYATKLREIINEFGEMPAIAGDKWQEAEFDWLETVGKIAHKYGLGILVKLEFSGDFTNNKVNRLYISEQDFDLPRELYVGSKGDTLSKALPSAYASRLSEFLGIEDMDVALTTATEFLTFERSLAMAMFNQHAGDSLAETYVLRSLYEAQANYAPQFDVKRFVKLAVGTLPNLKIYTDDDYLQNMLDVIKTTPKKVLANYIFYRLSSAFIMEIPETPEELADTCLTNMKKYFYKHFDNMVYRKFNSQETEQGVHDMWSHIKAAFGKQLQSSHMNWLSAETRQYALDKLKKMTLDIVAFKDTNFSEILGPLEFDEDDYLGNLQKIISGQAVYDRSNIGEVARQNDYGHQLSTTPAYIYVENSIKVPVAMLQPTYGWSASFPNAFNFGVLGALLSHEMIHGFDGDGRTFDAQGNNHIWWDVNSDRQFKKRSECLIHQYKDFIYDDQHLGEMPNQDENIADNGGVRLAYNAYLNWYENNRREMVDVESFPGMDFNYRQLFFTSYAYLWCSDSYSKLRSTIMAVDIHVPDKFRVIGPLSNFAEFSKEFNCPVGSKMNPAKKCEIY
ncbi:endothelin-converting enzyme homolog [Musca autumnalis]|uniref:endothelin-converting enzyme homolog n=1 Tax=Musca autumnalis TaxID=221902 RepID=UPI003CF7CC78